VSIVLPVPGAYPVRRAKERRFTHGAHPKIRLFTLGGAVVASYCLAAVKQLVSSGRYLITVSALETAAMMGFDDESIVECIVEQLADTHFYKTMPAIAVAGLMQDVYMISFEGQRVYLKLQINRSQNAVVISFKEDESIL
jgi:hypothetical protein